MTGSSSHLISKQLDSDKKIQNCIVLAGPHEQGLIELPVEVLKKHCQVTQIGDGERELNREDIDKLLKQIKNNNGRTLLYIKAHGGVFEGIGHVIGSAENSIKTTELLQGIAKNLGNKPIDIITSACYSAHVCEESASSILPPGSTFVGLGYGGVWSTDSHRIFTNLDTPAKKNFDVTAENLLKLYLTDLDAKDVNPEICSVRYSKPLAEELFSHVGRKFTEDEKESIYKELAYFASYESLKKAISEIENKKHNYFAHFNDSKRNSNLDLAIIQAAKKASFNKSDSREIKESISLSNPKTGSNMMKMVSYGYWKKNEWLLKQLKEHPQASWVSQPFKAVQHVLDFSGNFIGDSKDLSIPQRFEKAGLDTAMDMIWDHLIKRGPMLSAEVAGSVGDFMANRVEKQIRELEQAQRPNEILSPKLEVLYEGRNYFNLIRLPKLAIEGIKTLASDAYYKIFHPIPPSDQYSTTAVTLFNQLAPDAKDVLQHQSDYLLYRVQKRSEQSMLASDFMRYTAFKDELYGLQVENNLSQEQTQLLALYSSGRHSEYKAITNLSISAKPNSELLKTSLETLQTRISQDLLQHPDKSTIFQVVQQAAHKSQIIMQEPRALEKKDEIFAQHLHKTSTEIIAVSGLCSQIAVLSGSPKAARKITAIGSGVSQWLGGAAALAIGNPLMGLVGIGSAICSFFGGFFGDDDDGDNGLSIVSNQVNAVHHDIIKGFNEILTQQIEIARGLSKQIAFSHQQTMSRFDHVDNSLIAIQQQIGQAYRYLTVQNSQISQQISTLSKQLNDAEVNILKGLQVVHSDIIRSLKIISEGMLKGLTHVETQLTRGFSYLDQEVQMLSQEMHARMAEQMLYERQYFENLNNEQIRQAGELKQHSMQLDNLRQKELQAQKRAHDAVRKKEENYLTEDAEHILLSDSPLEKLDKSKLDYAFSKTALDELTANKNRLLSSEEILSELGDSSAWQENNVFDYINLLRSQENNKMSPLVHFPTQQKNLLALVKGLMQQKTVTPEELNQLKKEVEKIRDIVRFSHTLAKSDSIKNTFKEISRNVMILGEALEKQLMSYQQEFNVKCKNRLRDALIQHEINRGRLKKLEAKTIDDCYRDRMAQPLKIKVFEEEIIVTYNKPMAYFVGPFKESNLQYVLPLTTDKLPQLPKEILELEALGVGWIHFSYQFDPAKKQLTTNVEFQLSSSDKHYLLMSQHIKVNHQNEIENAWNQFKWPAQQKLELSEADYQTLMHIHEQSLVELRLQLNYKLQQDLNHPILQSSIQAVEASVAMLHAKCKLLFESFYLNYDQTLYDVLQSCLTADKLKQLLMGYQGGNPHPFLSFKNAQKWYDELAKNLIDALEKRVLYVDNVTLTNALLLLDNVVLELSPQEQRLAYLNQTLATLPEAAQVSTLLSRGTLLVTEKHDEVAALADYRQASTLNPDDNQIRANYADALFLQGQFEQAIQEYSIILEKISTNLTLQNSLPSQLRDNLGINAYGILLARGDAYIASGHTGAAYGDYQSACQLLPEQPEALSKRGWSYQLLNKLDLAIEDYQKSLELKLNDNQTMYRLATCYFKQAKKIDALTAGLKNEILKNKVLKTGALGSEVLKSKMLEAEALKIEAFNWYQKLLEKNPDSLDLKLQCAECNPNDKRTKKWLVEIINHPQTNIEDILRCGELSLQIKFLSGVRLAYEKIKHQVTTPEQLKRCALFCVPLKEIVQYVKYQQKLLVQQNANFEEKPPINQDTNLESLSSYRNTKSQEKPLIKTNLFQPATPIEISKEVEKLKTEEQVNNSL